MAVSRPVLPSSYTTSSAHLPVRSGSRPVIAKTDGQCLILKGVRFNDGKRYDIRIWRWDDEGNEIPLDEHMQFSVPALVQIQGIARDIFSYFKDPTLSKILYRDEPEMCESHTVSKIDADAGPTIDDMIAGGYTNVVNGARRIHQLLLPEARVNLSLDPNARLVIQPERLTPEEIGELNAKPPEPEIEGSPTSNLHPSTTSTSTTATPTAPSAPPLSPRSTSTSTAPSAPPPCIPVIPLMTLDQAALQFPNPLPFLKDVTYTALRDYAEMPVKKKEDKLYDVYQIYQAVVQDPTLNKIDTNHQNYSSLHQMKVWLQWIYCHAYKIRKEQAEFLEYFNKYEKQSFSGTFDDYCKQNAANSIIAFIRVQNMAVDPLIEELKTSPIPDSLNILLTN